MRLRRERPWMEGVDVGCGPTCVDPTCPLYSLHGSRTGVLRGIRNPRFPRIRNWLWERKDRRLYPEDYE